MSQDKNDQKKSYAGFIAAGILVALKSTKIIAALKLLKFTKPLVTAISLVISAIFYGIWLGPWFGIGFLAMLFIHEMGHIIALRIKGIETPGPVFIPFLGAAIFAPKFKDRNTEAFVAYGGPLVGTIAALGAFGLWFATSQTSQILLLVSYVGVFLNLFNLIPISPLDGGRITQIVGGWFKYVGLAILLALTLMIHQPQMLMIWVLTLNDFKNNLWFKLLLAIVLGLGMAICMALGFSSQPWYIDIIDCLAVTIFILIYWTQYLDSQKEKAIQQRLLELEGKAPDNNKVIEELPYPGLYTRLGWFACYLALAIVATIAMSIQSKYLPEAVHKDSQELTKPADQDKKD